MKIYKTKKGQPYIKLKSGKAKFIKKTRSTRSKPKIRAKTRTITKKRRTNTMARKKKSSSRRKSAGMLGNLNKPVMGAAGVIVYESIISPMIPLQGVAKDMLELVGGLYLSKKRGFVGAMGTSLVTINSYQILQGLVGSKIQGIMGSTATSDYSYNA